jgi:hypothetical protein
MVQEQQINHTVIGYTNFPVSGIHFHYCFNHYLTYKYESWYAWPYERVSSNFLNYMCNITPPPTPFQPNLKFHFWTTTANKTIQIYLKFSADGGCMNNP